MKFWIVGRCFMEEAGGEGGGGGGGEGQGQGEGQGAGEGQGEGGAGEGGEEEGGKTTTALGKALEKQGAEGKGNEPPENNGGANEAPTEEEVKAYTDAIKLDESIFGRKGEDFDAELKAKLPAFFKKHGIDPKKANEMANDYARMEKELHGDRGQINAEIAERIKAGNERYEANYDAVGQENIGRAVAHYFPPYKDKDGKIKPHPMVELFRTSEVGVDDGLLRLLHDVGERLPKGRASGAGDGTGSGGGKSLSDSFMGV